MVRWTSAKSRFVNCAASAVRFSHAVISVPALTPEAPRNAAMSAASEIANLVPSTASPTLPITALTFRPSVFSLISACSMFMSRSKPPPKAPLIAPPIFPTTEVMRFPASTPRKVDLKLAPAVCPPAVPAWPISPAIAALKPDPNFGTRET